MAPPAGVEPATYGLEVRRSLRLSYEGPIGPPRGDIPTHSTVGAGLVAGDMARPEVASTGPTPFPNITVSLQIGGKGQKVVMGFALM